MKSRKLITGVLLSLILVVALFIPAAASHQITSNANSVTLRLSAPDDTSFKDVPISIPAGYSFLDLSSISGVFYFVPSDGTAPCYVPFSHTSYAFQSSTMMLVNVFDCEHIDPYRRAFSVILADGLGSGNFRVNIAESDFEGSGIVELTFHFGDQVVVPDVPLEGFSVYECVYNLIHRFVYGNADLTADMSLTLTLVSTTACLFVIALPFLAIYAFFKRWL